MIEVGDRCRYMHRGDLLAALLNGDLVVTVKREHPRLGCMVEIEGSNGWLEWVQRDDLYRLRKSS